MQPRNHFVCDIARPGEVLERGGICLSVLCLLLFGWACFGQEGAEGPVFVPSVRGARCPEGVQVSVTVKVSPGAYIHEESFHVSVAGAATRLLLGDSAVVREDERVFAKDFSRLYLADGVTGDAIDVTVSYAGCLVSGMCLLPEEKVFHVSLDDGVAAAGGAGRFADSASEPLGGFRCVAVTAGYQSGDSFIQWLEDGLSDTVAQRENILMRVFRHHGLWLAALLLLPLGVLLNLTPCVLPMIPVTLAIIGAGERNGGRSSGFWHGGAYGLGMALAYGFLGIFAVLTGSQFGVLNGNGWFNCAVCGVFIALGLSMFDVFSIDFSRFRRGRLAVGGADVSWIGAFAMGALSAVLSGACIAPVLIWVLLLSADVYGSGRAVGMALPLLLGIGMGLPWPLLGAGLAKLPRPGRWMVRIRQALGVLIILLGVYYGWVGVRQVSAGGENATAAAGDWLVSLPEALARSDAEGKPVLIDFWGISCKNCTLMDRHVLSRHDVREHLTKFVCVKLRGDNADDLAVSSMMRKLRVQGFPTYVVLKNTRASSEQKPESVK